MTHSIPRFRLFGPYRPLNTTLSSSIWIKATTWPEINRMREISTQPQKRQWMMFLITEDCWTSSLTLENQHLVLLQLWCMILTHSHTDRVCSETPIFPGMRKLYSLCSDVYLPMQTVSVESFSMRSHCGSKGIPLRWFRKLHG